MTEIELELNSRVSLYVLIENGWIITHMATGKDRTVRHSETVSATQHDTQTQAQKALKRIAQKLHRQLEAYI